jgi:phage recombination protein Bet
MTNQQSRSPQNDRHPNAPSAAAQRTGAQRAAAQDQPAPPIAPEMPPARRKYLATQYGMTEDQITVVRSQVCLAATDEELEFFLATAKRVKLDPFSRQIFFIKRRQKIEDQWGNESWVDVGRPETSIDGLRTSAEQTGEYEGQAPYQWCGEDGQWRDVWIGKGPPVAARATVYRRGHREPMVHVALFSEYVVTYKNGNTGHMWQRMPANQIAKCAEAGSLRRAFPRDLSGLYIDVEMEHTSAGYSAPSAKESPRQLEETAESQLDLVALKEQIAKAKTRTDLAPVGKLCSSAHGKTDETSIALTVIVKPLLEQKWRELPSEAVKK